MDKILVGKKIKEMRKIKGLTQAQLAEIVSMHEKHISRIEQGKYLPTLENIAKIFSALDIELSKCNFDFNIPTKNSIKTEFLKFINSSTENELKFYLPILKQAQKGLNQYINKKS